MATEAKNTNYWISSSALYIQLNAMGEPDYIQCSVVSGASILCYMQGIPGLEYDAGHNYQRWSLAAYPSVFPDSERKYIYAAIPRVSTAENNTAVVVYPSERIDLYGYSIANPDKLVGDERYYYIYLQGIISEVKTDADGKTRKRDWLQHVDCGKLNTDESLSSGIDGTWWKYNSVTDSISFLKTILSATFDTLTAKVAKITKLFLGGSELNGVANDLSLETDNTKVVTPLYLGQFGVKHFLAKDKDDVAYGTITFEKVQKFLAGLNVGDFNSENGGSWTPDAEGRSHLITDYLEVRMKAIFEELVIKKTSTIGGKEILSPAGGVVAHKVEEVTVTYNNVSQKAYRCYFLAEQEGDAVDNDFAIGDQVRSESFNVRKGTYHKVGNHFYWRLVIGRDEDPVGLEGKKYHYIDLSDTDCATASDVPAKGDVLSQCGNRTDVERQNCLIFSAVDTYSPSVSLYHGINSYSFANKEYVEYGVNKQTNKAFFYVYGDMYVGDRPTKENNYEGSSYIKYDSATKQVSVKGKISAKSTVDGKELSQYIKENSAGGLTEEQVNNLIKNSQVIADLQNQVDGAIETWFYEGVPTLKNAPASSWTTDKDKDTHLGDLYYDNKTGKAYRFAKDGSTYKWTVITDTDIAKALSDAAKAQETADGKMKVFSTQPIPPYQLGDIWVNATYPTDGSIYKNEILRCQTAKAKGSSFAIADWTKASKYTDDSALNTFKEEYKNDMASYKEQLDEKVETWFYNYAPTTQNKPASDWTTDTLKSQHAGDLFYNTSKGYTYRWTGTAWARIKDNDINTAMTAASKAQDTADGKRTVFTSQPTVPYDEGDLWASGGDDGKTLMVCIKGRTTGSFTSSEWVKANDSDLNAFAKTIEESLNGIRDQLDKKAETWYQPSDPSASWTTDDAKKEHKGDLWYNTSNNQTFFWNGTKWDKQDVPTEVFDKIDGKSSIYVSKPASYAERDLWILEAAYTLSGVAYSKGELVVATKTNASFSADDWTKKVKYTDDTVANAAKTAAEKAQKAAEKAQGDISKLGTTVTDNKKAFDNYVTDGYLEPSEIAAMAQDSKRLEDAFAAAEKSYNEVKGAEVLKSTKELTNLNTAFTTLTTAKTELVTYLSDISARYNAANTEGKATIVSAVGTKFTNFQSAYSAFYDKLGLANAYITSKIYGDLKQNITDLAGYKYIKDALGQTTDIDGGLVMTTLLALRDAEGNVQSGINGAIDPNRGKKSIATWWGGRMVDKDYNSGNLTPATSLVRFDGSGYLANGAIWWDVDGKVHADPTSFIISEKNLGAYLTFFEPTWKAGSAGTSVADLVSLKPNAPFSKLGVSGDATFEGAISFHGIKLTYDATNKAIKIDGNLYATGGITAYGAASSVSGGGGLNASVISYARIIEGNYTDADLTSIPNAYAIKALSSRIDNIATELGGLNLSWNNITGKPSTFAPSAHTHKWAEITDRITKVSQLTNDSGYTKNTGTVTSVSLTLPAGLTCATKTITTSGTFAISLASGYSIPTTAKQTAWDSAYDWYALMTTDEETADGIINKWNEVVSFLANIAQTDTLSGIVDGINKSISDEVARAKKAEGVNASGISANKTSITTLQGYFTNGSAKKALQLTNARKLWGNSFNGTADINGSIIVPSGKYISIGNIKMEYDAANKALKITNTTTEEVANLYTSGGVSAYGVGASSSSGGGLNGSVKAYADAIRLTTENLSEIASAYSVAKLYSEIQNVASAVPSISVSVPTGGNALTGATYDASTGTITFTKGTFLTAHQSLDSYVNEIAVSGTGNAITAVSKSGKKVTFTKGATYLTTHQSLAAYATQNWVKNEATAHNADMVDNYHASGLFTGFSISDVANKVTISIGGTSKALNLVRAFPSGVGNNFNDIATHGNSMGMSYIAAPYASSTANYQTLNGYVNPNGQAGWHHYINLSYTDSNNTATSPNMWQTQFAIKAGTTEVYVRSRAGGKISNDAAWAAPWVRLARVTDNVASASKVANALSWSGYSSGSYNGSAVKSISIPNNTNQLTNGAGFITSSASITGNAGSATKLQNARTINGTSFNGTANIVTSYWGTTRKLWGNSVNGNADVNGSITIANTDGVYVQIGDVRLVYDKANTAIKVVKSDGTTAANFYATGGITAYGEGSGSSGGGGLNGSVKSYADALKLTSESLSEVASAYSIKALDSRISSLEGGSATSIETTGSGNAVTSVSKSGTKITFTKGSTFSLNGHTHTFASLTSKPSSLSGYGITDGVNAISVTGSGNAVTAASVSGHTLTLTKGSTFCLSNHTHYVGTTQVQGSSAEQALTGITKIDNILKLSKATVTVNTSYKAEQNRLVIYGNTYGNDANYIKSARKLSYGDGGPQLVFSTSENPDASGVQSAALVYTDHDTIGAGVSLSFVTNQGDAYFIAPHIKALTAFQGNLAWSYITNKPTTLSGFGITDGLRSVTHSSGSNVFVTGISTSGTAITYTKSYTKKSLSAVGTSGWTNASIDGNIIPDMSFIAHWNGAYSGTISNLVYCNKGAFGSFAIKNSLAFSELTSKPTTISGYGITDAYTKSQVDAIAAKYLPLTGGTLTGQLKIVASALDGAYNGLRIGDDCYIGDCNFVNTIGLMGVDNNNAGMVKFGKGGMKFGYNGSNHIASTTAQWTNLNADLLDGWHKDNIVWSGAVNSNTASLSHYWAKLFDITVTDNQNNDRSFTFLFSNGYNDTYSVVVLRIRQNGAKDSGAYNFSISLRELVGNMSSRLRVYYNNATGNVQLWGNCQGQYGCLSYTIIKKTGRTSADFASQGTLVTNSSFSAAQSLPATTGNSPYTLLDGATRIGIVKQADQLVTARSLWGQSFNGTANVSGNMTGVGNINTSAAPAGTIYTNNWFRSKGSSGWYSEDHGGGWYMSDNTWIRNFGGKDVFLSNKLSVNGNVGIGTTAPSHKLHVSGEIYTTTKVNINGIILEKDSNGDLKVNGNLSAYMKTADAKSLFLYHTRENIVTDLDNFNTSGASHIYEMVNVTNTPTDNHWLQVMNWGSADANYGMLLANDYNSNGSLYFRHKVDGKWNAWKTLIDSSNIANQSVKYAATATKLQTARTIWGQSFNGTANVSGNMTGVGNINTSAAPAGTIYTNNWFRSKGSSGWYSEDHGGGWYMSDNTWIRNFGGKDVFLSNKLSVNGNVGIGTTAPSHKLHVSGEIYTTTKVNINGIILEKDSNGDLKVNGNLSAYMKTADAKSLFLYHTRENIVTDLDNFNTSGASHIYEMVNVTNTPTDNHWLQVMNWGSADANYGMLLANDYNSNGSLYFRHKVDGKWNAWKTLIDSSNIANQSVKYAATATKLQTARTIWGQSFNGTANVSGSITGVNNITMSNNSYLYGKNTGGTAIQLIAMASWNSVDIGRGALTYGYTTQVMGKTVALTASDDSGKNTKSVELSTAKLYSNVNIETEGGLLAHGGVTAYSSSDIRLKQDLRKLDYLGIIKAMGGTFSFAWKKDNTRSIGWIAQHVLCNPHLKDIVETDEKGYYKINYWSSKLIATAFGAIEQVGDEVSRLKTRVVFLESEVQRLSGKQDGSNKKRLDNKNINLLN